MSLALEKDDLNHEPAKDPSWRESYVFSFYDQKNNIGMYTSMGERPYKDHAGAIIGVWGKMGPFVHNFIFDKVTRTARIHKAQTCIYECLEPLKRWHLTYKGNLPSYKEASLRLDPAELTRKAALKRPMEHIEYDLIWEGISPCAKYKTIGVLWDLHLEQHGHVSGWLKVGTERFEIDALGFRDRSCGTRNWLEVGGWTWTPTYFPEPLPLVGLIRWKQKGRKAKTDGYIFDRNKGKLEQIVASREEVERSEAEYIGVPTKVTIEVEGNLGTRFSYSGEVLKIVPVVLVYGSGKRGTMGGLKGTCWIDRCIVKYTFGKNVTGYGEVELAETLNYPVTFDN